MMDQFSIHLHTREFMEHYQRKLSICISPIQEPDIFKEFCCSGLHRMIWSIKPIAKNLNSIPYIMLATLSHCPLVQSLASLKNTLLR